MDKLQVELLASAHRLQKIVHTIGANYPLARYCVNIGAGDGIGLDLVHPLFLEDGFAGVAIEGNPETFNSLCNNLPAAVKKLNKFVDPYSILSMLNDTGVPHHLDLVDIDIDGFDYFIAQKIFCLEPKVISMELHEDVPPGIKFACLYDPNYVYGKGVPWGCSIDMVVSLGKKHGYQMIMMDWNSIFLVHGKYTHLFEIPVSTREAYRLGYYERPHREELFYWKTVNNNLFELSTEAAYQKLLTDWAPNLDKIVFELTQEIL